VKIAIVVGSLRTESYNKNLAEAIVERLPGEHEIVWVSPELPLLNTDVEDDMPSEIRDSAQAIADCDGILIVSPEYNRSFSGVLKNWLDWMSRESVGYPLDGKRGAIAGAAAGTIGTAVMQSQLRPVLAHIGMEIMALPEVFISVPNRMLADGSVPEATDRLLQKYGAAFIKHITE
jgi:chromate reductase